MKLENYTQRKSDLDEQNFMSTCQMAKGTVDKITKNEKNQSQFLVEKVYHFQTINEHKLERSVSAKKQVKHFLK